jgi:hypothetical protein
VTVRTGSRGAVAVWLASLAASVAALALVAATWTLAVPSSWGFRGAIPLLATVFATIGVLVASRRPDNRIGRLLLAIGALWSVVGLAAAYAETVVFALGGDGPLLGLAAWLLAWIWVPPVWLATVGLPLLFPDGRLVSAGWRPVAGLAVAGAVLQCVAFALLPGPVEQVRFLDNPAGAVGIDPSGGLLVLVFVAWPACAVLGVVSLLRRWRHATGETRQQLKVLAGGGLVALGAALVYVASATATGGRSSSATKAAEALLVAGVAVLPLSIGVAILRYRLYDIDRVVSRTLGWTIVTGLLLALFAALVVALQAALSGVTQGETLAVAASTLVAFVLFQPLRRRVQRAVDLRFNRARYDAEATAERFAGRLRSSVDLGAVRGDLLDTVDAAFEPSAAGLWIRPAPAEPRVARP